MVSHVPAAPKITTSLPGIATLVLLRLTSKRLTRDTRAALSVKPSASGGS